MAIALGTVASSIAALTVNGVTIKDIDEIVPEVYQRNLPVLYPEPVEFVSGFSITIHSQGSGGSARMDIEYDLTYTFLHHVVGSDRSFELYDDMVAKAMQIIDAILANDTITGAVDIQVRDVISFGPLTDPVGTLCNGCKLRFHVLEFGPGG